MAFQMKLICNCGHLEIDHKMRNKSVAEILHNLQKSGQIEVQHHPDYFEPIGYFLRAENKMYTVEEMKTSIVLVRDNYSPCEKKYILNGCKCTKFKADNLKSLENLL